MCGGVLTEASTTLLLFAVWWYSMYVSILRIPHLLWFVNILRNFHHMLKHSGWLVTDDEKLHTLIPRAVIVTCDRTNEPPQPQDHLWEEMQALSLTTQKCAYTVHVIFLHLPTNVILAYFNWRCLNIPRCHLSFFLSLCRFKGLQTVTAHIIFDLMISIGLRTWGSPVHRAPCAVNPSNCFEFPTHTKQSSPIKHVWTSLWMWQPHSAVTASKSKAATLNFCE